MTLGLLPARLLAVTRSSFVAEERQDDLAPARTGGGVVRTTRREDGAIEWEESGTWTTGGDGVRYRNRLRWTFDGSEIELHHLRRGDHSPVHLLTLARDDEGVLTPRAPHRCGPDVYMAAISVTPAEIEVSWEVRGPRKGYHLTTRYR